MKPIEQQSASHTYATFTAAFTRRLLLVLYTLDSFVLALLTLGNCKIGETISSVAWVLECDGKPLGKLLRPLVDTVLWFDKNHCQQAYMTYYRITSHESN